MEELSDWITNDYYLFNKFFNIYFYVKVGQTCGYQMEEDRLKIPSTKRICFVGRRRIINEDLVKTKIKTMVQQEEQQKRSNISTTDSSHINKKLKTDEELFSPRPADIAVRNCSQISRSTSEKIVSIVVERCLETKKPLSDILNSQWEMEPVNLDWNMGRSVSLGELASNISPNLLKELKNGCGGLQTFLRNNNFIFIVEKGCVRLRCHATDASEVGKRKKNIKSKSTAQLDCHRKRKLCWFFQNHPQGCPVSKESCHWAHGKDDLTKNDISHS